VKPSDPGEAGASVASAPPPSAAALFGDRLGVAQEYVALLATEGIVRGLIGPREAPRLWDRHVVNSALLATRVEAGATVADVGSGAGLPGVVVAIARPDLDVTLVEPLLRRTTFLEEAVERLGLENVAVRRARADALHGAARFDVVTARAVAPLDRLVGWCMPLVAPTGALLAMKGASAVEEVGTARSVLEQLGCAEPTIEVYGEDQARQDPAVEPIRVVRVTWADPTRVSWPTSGSRSGGGPGSRSGSGSGSNRGRTRRRGGHIRSGGRRRPSGTGTDT
jgi:16S rRNA (guanine527-N7)-methyltransferase